VSFRRYAAERAGIALLVPFLRSCYICFHVIGIDPDTSRSPHWREL
jgi:hypothetical protein